MECDHEPVKQQAQPKIEDARPFIERRLDALEIRIQEFGKATDQLAVTNKKLEQKVGKVKTKRPITITRSDKTSSSGGIGLGTVIAVALSYNVNHDIFWAIVHGIFGWFYVVY
jgi:hypothetical protein